MRSNALRTMALFVMLGALALVTVLSLAVGNRPISPAMVVAAIFSYDGSELHDIIRSSRWPRTLIGLLVGPALGLCGALIQSFTRNPLADPGILGVNAGASFAATFAITYLGVRGSGAFVWFAMLGAFAVTVLVYALGSVGRERATPIKLTLAGVAVSAVLGGFTSAMVVTHRDTLDIMRFWGVGSLGGRDTTTVVLCGILIAIGVVIGLACARPLNALGLGDDLATSLGVKIGVVRTWIVVAVTLLAGAAVSLAGPIGFVGLMVPHVVRWFVGPDQRWVMTMTVVVAPILLLTADIVGRVVTSSGELRVGLVTALVGAPVLIALVRRSRASGL